MFWKNENCNWDKFYVMCEVYIVMEDLMRCMMKVIVFIVIVLVVFVFIVGWEVMGFVLFYSVVMLVFVGVGKEVVFFFDKML